MRKPRLNEQDALDHATVRRIESQEEFARFSELIEPEHYLHSSRVAGKVIRHVAEYRGRWGRIDRLERIGLSPERA